MTMRTWLAVLLAMASGIASAQTIETFVGGQSFRDSPALSSPIGTPHGMAHDSQGRLYFGSQITHSVYRLDPVAGKVSLFAGQKLSGVYPIPLGDGGAATAASLQYPEDIAVDAQDNVYIADRANNRVRRVDGATGIITTFAGTGSSASTGDGGLATAAAVGVPMGLAFDAGGNLYVSSNSGIRRIDAVTGIISTFAGTPGAPTLGDGGQAIAANLLGPQGLAFDGAGNLFVADSNHNRIRRIDAVTGIITSAVGPSAASVIATLSSPQDVEVDAAGQLYVADTLRNEVILADPATGTSVRYAGSALGTFNASSLFNPGDLLLDASGVLYIADTANNRIRRVDSPNTVLAAGTIATVAGNGTTGFGGDGGVLSAAALEQIQDVAVDRDGNLFIADLGNSRVRRVDAATGVLSTYAGTGTQGTNGDGGLAADAALTPAYLALDGSGNLYISGTTVIRKVDRASGIISTVAGTGSAIGSTAEGVPAITAAISASGIAVDAAGNLYLAEIANHRVRRVDGATGLITTYAGNGSTTFSGDGGPALGAGLSQPVSLALDAAGNLHIADNGHSRIRKVDAQTGIITTFAGGSGATGSAGDGGPAILAGLGTPRGLAVDASGNVYVAQSNFQVVRRIDATTGIITRVAGSGTAGVSGDGGAATAARLATPNGLAFDPQGNLYISDNGNDRIRRVLALAPPVDHTPPTVTPSVVGTLGNNGWYTSSVTISWTVNDAESAVSSQNGCDTAIVASDTGGSTFTCVATSTGGTTTESVTVRRDATAPTATATALPMPNAAGWNNTDVTVSLSGVDALSGVAGCSASVVLAAEGVAQSASGTCTDNAGNTSATATATGINIDRTPPVIAASRSPLANAAGWNVTPVTVSFLGQDSLSGMSPNGCTPPVLLGGDGAGQAVSGSCTDRAGNSASLSVGGINIDTTLPVAVATADPPPNANGWNNTDVTVTISATDILSGSGVAQCLGGITLTAEAGIRAVHGFCIDLAGNRSAPVTALVRIDKSPPVISIVSPEQGASYETGSTVLAEYSCTDTFSPTILGCDGPPANGSQLDTSAPGARSFQVTATDFAGNVASKVVEYQVVPPSTVSYRLVDLGTLGGTDSSGHGINNAGQVTGFAATVGNTALHPFIWEKGTLRDLGTLGGAFGEGQAINGSGQIAGTSATGGNVSHAFLWDGASIHDLGTLGGSSSFGIGLGDAGQVVGWSLVAGDIANHAFLWDGTTFGDLGTLGGTSSFAWAINAAGQVVGSANLAGDAANHAFIWENGTMRDIGTLGGTFSNAGGINAIGQVTGDSTIAGDMAQHAFLWTAGEMHDLGTLGGTQSYGAAVNSVGQVAGWSYTSWSYNSGNSNPHAFVWDGIAMRDLNTRIDVTDSLKPFVTLSNARGINDAGQIVADGCDSRTNECHAYLVTPVVPDSTPPVVTPKLAGTLGDNGWYTGDVSVSWSVSDPESPITSQTGCDVAAVTADTAGTTFSCTTTSSGGTATQSVTVRRDVTAPVATASQLPMPNANGWNNGNVTVAFSGTDATSGIASCTAASVLVAEGQGQSASGSCTDIAGNTSAAVTASGINIDRTPPLPTATRAPPPNAAGWNATAVVVSFAATDALSGVVASGCTAPVTVASNGTGQSATGTCVDRAGNVASTTVGSISVDTVPPAAVATALPAPNANGWNNSDVTVTFAGTDSLLGSGIANCSPPAVLASDGVYQAVSGVCVDVAGNGSAPVTAAPAISLDKTPPLVTIATPNGGSYVQGAVVNASYACTDALSGVAQCGGSVANGAAIDTGTVGTRTFAASAVDKAGNAQTATATYTVTVAVGDTSPPAIQAFCNGIACSGGWYSGNVALTWLVSDPQSAILATTGCGARNITADTTVSGRSFTCTARSAGGSSSVTATIRRDSARPTIALLQPSNGQLLRLNQVATALYRCADALSGLASCSGTVANGSGLDTSTRGTKTFSVTAADNAGNIRTTTVQFRVR